MISIENCRAWHQGLLEVLQRTFPGLRIVHKSKVNPNKSRWEFETIIFPPGKKSRGTGSYFTFADLNDDEETVLEVMKIYPQALIKQIRKELE